MPAHYNEAIDVHGVLEDPFISIGGEHISMGDFASLKRAEVRKFFCNRKIFSEPMRYKEVVQMHDKIRNILFVGLFISLEVIFTRFLSVENAIVRVSFEFLPIAISAILFGPVTAGVAAAVADILGMLIFPKGPYFPGFTVSQFLTGFLYGIILYKRKITIARCIAAAVMMIIPVELISKTLWLKILTHNGIYAILPARIIKCLVFFPIQVILIFATWKYAGPVISRYMDNKVRV